MKFIPLFLFSFFICNNLLSQDNSHSKHFASFHFGYSIPVSSSQIGSPRKEIGNTYLDVISKSTGDEYSEKNSYGSRGSGFNVSLSYGYMITKNISVEMDLSFLQTLKITDASILNSNGDGSVNYKAEQTSNTTMFRATPLVGIYADEDLLIRPYAKFGLIIPLAGGTNAKLYIEDASSESFYNLMPVIDETTYLQTKQFIDLLAFQGIMLEIPTVTEIEAVTTGSFSLGFDARLGAEYKIVKNLNLFFEMNMQMLTIKSNKTTIKKFNSTVNSDAIKTIAESQGLKTTFTIDDIPTILIETKYVDEVTHESNASYEDAVGNDELRDKAFNQLSFRDNYNAFGFLLGVKFGF